VLNEVDNLCPIGGDAAYVLKRHFVGGCCDSIFINHPEPPERTGGVDDSEGDHLLTAEFFDMLRNVLVKGGTITLVTDNLAYGKSLAATCAKVGMQSIKMKSKRGGLKFNMPVIATELNSKGGSVVLYEGEAGPECGHHVASSSYFDRLWKGGSKTRRFFFCVA
jgi:tRNA G46 methylase TrmB